MKTINRINKLACRNFIGGLGKIIENTRFSRFAKTAMLCSIAAILGLPPTRVHAEPPVTGQWKFTWGKTGWTYATATTNNYGPYPTVQSVTPWFYTQDWPDYDRPGFDGNPVEFGPSADHHYLGGVGEHPGANGHTNFETYSEGSIQKSLVWVPGTSDDLPPNRVMVLEFFESINTASGVGEGPIKNFQAKVKNGIGSGEQSFTTGKKSQGWLLRTINNPQHDPVVPLESKFMRSQGSFTADPWTFSGSNYVDITRYTYLPVITLGVRRRGSSDPFSNIADVAAGGVVTDEHDAELQLTISLPPEVQGRPPLQGIKIPNRPEILRGFGIVKHAYFIPAPDPITDIEGKAIIGFVRSSDKVKSTPPLAGKKDRRVEIRLPIGRRKNNPRVRTNQIVGGAWAMGDDGQLPWDPYFAFGQTLPIVYREQLTTSPLVPIRTHDLTFYVARVKVREWEDDTKVNMVNRVYLLDDPELEIPDEPGAIRKDLEFMAKYANLLDFNAPPPGPNDVLRAFVDSSYADGLYRAKLYVPENDEWLVEELQLGMKDSDAYVKKSVVQ